VSSRNVAGSLAQIALVLSALVLAGCADRLRLFQPVWSAPRPPEAVPAPVVAWSAQPPPLAPRSESAAWVAATAPPKAPSARVSSLTRPESRRPISFSEGLDVPPVDPLFTYDFDLLPPAPLRDAPDAPEPTAPPGERQKHYGRAAFELFSMVGPFGTTWYWYNQDFNQSDWELKWDSTSWRRKLITFDAVRFDSNHFRTNAFLHPFATGMWYHVAGRSNNLNMVESVLLSTATSTAWEYLVEFRELVSLNDVFVTPLGGLPFGEAVYQYGELFSRGNPSSLNGLLSTVFGIPQRFHAWIDGAKIQEAPETDRFGFPTDVAHAFDVSVGAGVVATPVPEGEPKDRIELSVHTEIITVKPYGKPGTVSWVFTDDIFSEVAAKFTLGSGEAKRISAFAQTSFGGLYWQDIRRDGSSGLHGASFFAGLGSAYEYSIRTMPELEDRWAVVSVIGPMLDFSMYRGQITARARLATFGDVAMVSPYPAKAFLRDLNGRATKSELSFDGYYFGFGASAMPEVSVRAKWFDIGVKARFDYIQSIDGLDRREELIEVPAVAEDLRATSRVWLAYVFPDEILSLSVSREDVLRSGQVSNYRAAGAETVYLGSLAFLF
jgi:hypothetical protein